MRAEDILCCGRFLAGYEAGGTPRARVERRYVHEGLSVEELSWQLPVKLKSNRRTGLKKLMPRQ